MESTSIPNQPKYNKWLFNAVIMLSVWLPITFRSYLGLSLLQTLLIVLVLLIVLPYWFFTGPRKITFPQYAWKMSVILGSMSGILLGIPMLLKAYIPFGYAMGVTSIIFWHAVYAYVCWKKPDARQLSTYLRLLVITLLFSLPPIWIEYRTNALLKQLTQI